MSLPIQATAPTKEEEDEFEKLREESNEDHISALEYNMGIAHWNWNGVDVGETILTLCRKVVHLKKKQKDMELLILSLQERMNKMEKRCLVLQSLSEEK